MNLEQINKWLDNEYGVSYTRLEELHDFVVEQDMKHQEQAEKEISRLNNIINEIHNQWKELSYSSTDYNCKYLNKIGDLSKSKELKENRK